MDNFTNASQRLKAFAAAVMALGLVGFADTAMGFAQERAAMVERIRAQVRAASPDAVTPVFDRVLAVVASVARERFVPDGSRGDAYRNTPLPIGYDQTISDAYVVILMTAALRLPPHANVLDIGTGSGYQAAVLSPLSDRVSSIEIVKPLADQAGARLAGLGYGNVTVRAGDGFAGWPDRAPFDGIVVAAGAAKVPQQLLDQLKPGGRLVMPIGATWATEQILVYHKTWDGRMERCSLGWAMFVPLTGRGERSPDARGLFDRTIPLCYKHAVVSPVFAPQGD